MPTLPESLHWASVLLLFVSAILWFWASMAKVITDEQGKLKRRDERYKQQVEMVGYHKDRKRQVWLNASYAKQSRINSWAAIATACAVLLQVAFELFKI